MMTIRKRDFLSFANGLLLRVDAEQINTVSLHLGPF